MPDLFIVGDGDIAHLAELFEAVARATDARADMHLTLRRQTRTALTLERRAPQPSDIGTFRHAHGDGLFALVAAGIHPLGSIPDPDPLVFGNIERAGRRARVAGQRPASFLRHAVALAVGVLDANHPDARWRATEVILDLRPTLGTVEVELKSQVAGRFFKFTLYNAGRPIGSLFLARAPSNESP